MATGKREDNPKITLTMNEEEARTLRDILSNVGGKVNIIYGLIAGMNEAGFNFRTTRNICEGTLRFK